VGNVRTIDFFVSYNKNDKQWAEWIAWTLENAGYTTLLQAWDFRAGGNFVIEMQRAVMTAERLIAVMTPDYLSARFTQSEWASIFVLDPEGLERRLIPVMVKPCRPTGLLAAIINIRLFSLTETDAHDALLNGVGLNRPKPLTHPPFPGEET
jgi:hypothetical protein